MTQAFVLLTALPPTTGHRDLIEFATGVADRVEVILCTQPGEPYGWERYEALAVLTRGSRAHLNLISQTIPQEPEDDPVGFWDMWVEFLADFGFVVGDYIVASESYGITLAEKVGGVFIPYDIERTLNPVRATQIRDNPLKHFKSILPEFQNNLRQRITIFGAESTGKTTLTRLLGRTGDVEYTSTPEWARPYLEAVGAEITYNKMRAIWAGQRALQDHATTRAGRANSPFIFQDTDLFSTVGYWQNSVEAGEPWTEENLVPAGLIADASIRASDLYIITPSDIPFEADPLRYGGDKRETSDQYWIDICENYGLPYVVLSGGDSSRKWIEAYKISVELFNSSVKLDYVRSGKDH